MPIKLIWSVILIVFLVSPVFAQSSTGNKPSSQSTRSAELRKQLEEKVAPLKRQAYVGPVVQKTQDSLVVKTQNGNKTILTTEVTTFVNLTGRLRQNADFTKIKVGDNLVAIGAVETDGTMTARVVLQVAKKSEITKRVIFGVVADISGRVLTVQNPRNRIEEDLTIVRTAKITIKGKKDGIFADIKEGDKIIAVGVVGSNDTITVNLMTIIPKMAEFNKEATVPGATKQ